MAVEQPADEEVTDPLLRSIGVHLGRTLLYAPLYFLSFAASTFLLTLAMLSGENQLVSIYVYAGLVGYALYGSQLAALDEVGDEEQDLSVLTKLLLVVWVFLYCHTIMFFSVAISIALATAGLREAALIAAFVIPVGDIYLNRAYDTGLAHYSQRPVEWLGETVARKLRGFDHRALMEQVVNAGFWTIRRVVPVVGGRQRAAP